MSKYVFEANGERWAVGYDEPLASYFAQVEPLEGSIGDDDLVDLTGPEVGAVPTFDALAKVLDGRVELPGDVARDLRAAEPAVPESAVQQAARWKDDLLGSLSAASVASMGAPVRASSAVSGTRHLEVGVRDVGHVGLNALER